MSIGIRTMSHGDHPRTCGEHASCTVLAMSAGIIPAHAGNTSPHLRSDRVSRDHPRTCGEHAEVDSREFMTMGSSPHMRGTRHPHRLAQPDERGSSPHMRGTLDERDAQDRRVGIIPAHAGNTRRRDTATETCWDHPRTCGEHEYVVKATTYRKGSSPHMRGTLIVIVVVGLSGGIIPAHAGNTSRPHSGACRPRDHPRTCGEHEMLVTDGTDKQGSSPHMRGTHEAWNFIKHFGGIIPAHAGNTTIELDDRYHR